MWYLYILRNENDALYTGITDNLTRRFTEHYQGKGGQYTKYSRPVKIVFTQQFMTRHQAENREQQIKRWTRVKKLALINQDFEKLRKLSVSKD